MEPRRFWKSKSILDPVHSYLPLSHTLHCPHFLLSTAIIAGLGSAPLAKGALHQRWRGCVFMQGGDALIVGESCLQEEKDPWWKAIQQGQRRSVLLIIDQSSVRGEKGCQRCVLGRKDPGCD